MSTASCSIPQYGLGQCSCICMLTACCALSAHRRETAGTSCSSHYNAQRLPVQINYPPHTTEGDCLYISQQPLAMASATARSSGSPGCPAHNDCQMLPANVFVRRTLEGDCQYILQQQAIKSKDCLYKSSSRFTHLREIAGTSGSSRRQWPQPPPSHQAPPAGWPC